MHIEQSWAHSDAHDEQSSRMLHTSSRLTIAPSPLALLRTAEVPYPARSIARGDVVRVRHGVYAQAAEWAALTPWDRYLARVHAVAMLWPDVVFSHESAAALARMPIFRDPVIVHVIADPSSSSRVLGGIRLHTTQEAREVFEASGLLLTPPGDTAVTLARARHNGIGLAMTDAALRIDPRLSPARLNADNARRSSSRGRRVARWVLDRTTPAAETPLESLSRAVIEWLGFPAPATPARLRFGSRRD